ncbi:MAG: GIY-YIG nuclease family protein [Ketobacter sp.]|nr:GIY-YIG nuclease family protein [Ketobacter sp.]
MMGVIYFINFKNSSSGKIYVGSSVNYKNRCHQHLSLLRRSKHHSIALQRAFVKYGSDNLFFEILEDVQDNNLLINREQFWIDKFKGKLYNCSFVAASRLGIKMSQDACQKISGALIGNQLRKGIPHSEDDRRKISKGLKKAYADGRKKLPSGNASYFETYLDDIRAGRQQHPKKLPHDRIIAILTKLYETGSLQQTAEAFGICKGSVWYTAKQFRAKLDDYAEIAIGLRPKKKRRSTTIHPDWFSLAKGE